MSTTATRLSDVITFIEQEVPRPRPHDIGPETDLRGDLRLHWDDAETVLERFFQAFSVDSSGFDFDLYFPAENFLFRLKRAAIPPRLTVQKLADAAASGMWRND